MLIIKSSPLNLITEAQYDSKSSLFSTYAILKELYNDNVTSTDAICTHDEYVFTIPYSSGVSSLVNKGMVIKAIAFVLILPTKYKKLALTSLFFPINKHLF